MSSAGAFQTVQVLVEGDLKAKFLQQGLLHIPGAVSQGFLDGLRLCISRRLASLVSALGMAALEPTSSQDDFDVNLMTLKRLDPLSAAAFYDSVKKIPQVLQWSSHPVLVDAASHLLGTPDVGVASRGWGVRIDYPEDEVHKTQLHQEFVSQMCSPKGVVFWTPLRDVTAELGPVVSYPGSHRYGLFPVSSDGRGSRDQVIRGEVELRSRFAKLQSEVKAGDLLIMDFMLLHESGHNRGAVPRWSMTSRLFDASDEAAVRIIWRGGIQEGNVISDFSEELSHLFAQ